LAKARETGAKAYLEQIKRFRQIYQRLEERRPNFPRAEYAQSEIKRKTSHLKHRAQLPHRRVARIPSVLREAFNGGYWRYSAGWKSIAKDLVVG
jgi:hypothetical protein